MFVIMQSSINGNEGSVSIFLTQTGCRRFRFVVKDTGVGIPKEDQDKCLRGFTGWIKVIPKGRLEVQPLGLM